MRTASTTAAALALATFAALAQVPAPAPQQPPTPAAPQQPPTPAPPSPAPAVPAVSAPTIPPPTGARTFTAQTGMIFQSVRPERVADFEAVIGYLQAALEKSTNPTVRAQAQGWRIYKATEAGPNGTVIYVLVLDPTVAGADYSLGTILAEAYPEKIQELWKLYQGALGPSANLLNLMPLEGPPPAPPAPAPATPPATRPAPPAGRGTTPPAGRGGAPAR
ncbi:MAG: hypothetical protein HY657_14585 [Acidobacteria bacterium]|nr:hypothetical protein [Acidobacteriota bacterium]